jgi:hypothetical protein
MLLAAAAVLLAAVMGVTGATELVLYAVRCCSSPAC